MIYTLGKADLYDELFTHEKSPWKLGRYRAYCGGSVWKTREAAEKHRTLCEGYKVYGVLADWEKDTEPSEDGDWHDLLVTAELVQLDKGSQEYIE